VLKRACVKRLVDLPAAANNEAVAKLEQQLKDAEENAGETEIRDAFLARAEHYATIGDKVRGTTRARVTVRGALTPERCPTPGRARHRGQAQALEWYNKTFSKSVGAGMKLDVLFSIIRIGFFFSDMSLTSSTIDKARTYVPRRDASAG